MTKSIVVGLFLIGSSLWLMPCLNADIIGAKQAPTAKVFDVPEALLTELDSNIAVQLKPLIPLFANNDFANFKSGYQQIAATTDTLPAVEVFWAKLFITQNRLSDALKVLEEYARDHQEDPEVYLSLGIVAVRSGRMTDAWLNLLFAQRLLDRESFPKARYKLVLPSLLEARAVVAEGRKQWSEAEQHFSKLQALNPANHSIKWRAGRSQVLAGKIKEGHEIMSSASFADDKLPKASLAVAQLLAETTDWIRNADNKALVEQWFTQAVTEQSGDHQGWMAYYKWLLLDNRPEMVRDSFNKLATPLQANREVVLMRVLAARYLDDLATAELLLAPLHQANPEDLEVADQLALVLVESSDEAKRGRALQLAERNLRAAPDAEVTAATAAWVQMQLGSKDVADRILSQIVSRGPLSAQTTYYIAELLRKSGRESEGLRLLKAAVDTLGLFPQRGKARAMLTPTE
jgi:predicted Zn-dependent protease